MFFKSSGVYISNPFKLYWEKNWTFQIVHMEGGIHIEAKGLGISLRAPFLPNDNMLIAADRLILKEEKYRNSLYNAWKSRYNNERYYQSK